MARSADISTEMKRRAACCLFCGLSAFVFLALIWGKACRLIDVSWLAVLSPLLVTGAVTMLVQIGNCVLMLLAFGRLLVARSDLRARNSFTIRNRRR